MGQYVDKSDTMTEKPTKAGKNKTVWQFPAPGARLMAALCQVWPGL
jgi:hypothetical protein